jgi:signal transduction histidine kinase
LYERDPIKGQDRLAKLRQMSRGALAEMRALLLELRPSALMESEIDVLLVQLGEALNGREGIPVQLNVQRPCRLPAEMHIAVYRIAQEALNNVVKHARPSQVEIFLQTNCSEEGALERVVLKVADDGLGFNPDEVTPGRMGLIHMHERAAAIGAELSIQSDSGAGTVIQVVWPADT